MNHASLFSGIGGAEVAASMMGWQNLFHCEIQEFPRKVLDYWFPNSESYEDITKTDFGKWRGKVDVLTGGFPCQPFSLAGRRKGADDNRYLWPQMLRAIREIHPTWVVGENVAGIKTMVESCQVAKMGRTDYLFEENYLYREESRFTLDKICADLEAEGYAVQPITIPACAVGAPHRRDRVWIVAHANSNRPRSRKNKQKSVTRCSRTPNLGSRRSKRIAANSNRHGDKTLKACAGAESSRSNRISEQEERLYSSERTDRLPKLSRNDAHSICPRLEGLHQSWCEESEWQRVWRNFARCSKEVQSQDRWRNFPTQSPVCRGNDGIPFDVDGLTISFARWRQESIKAYGNAWVPAVAYEIFLAIEAEEKAK